MNLPSLATLLLLGSSLLVFADAPAFLAKGDRIAIEIAGATTAIDPSDLQVLELSPTSNWVQVEFNKGVRKGDGSAGTEKAKIWLNFDNVFSVRKLPAK